MTEAAPPTTPPPSPPDNDVARAIEALVEALKQDAALRTEAMLQMNQLIDRRNAIVQARTQKLTERSRADIEGKMSRAKWYTGVLALFAVGFGLVLFYMVFAMTRDMGRMEDYMYNMGHATADARKRPHERKIVGVSFMNSMAGDMAQMRTDMASMNRQISTMSGDMQAMRGAMLDMDGSIGGMTTNIGRMTGEMNTITATMGRMQFDTQLLRHGVGSMSNDTRAMGAPFRVMDSFLPW